MKKRIAIIITASILVLILGSFIGIQAYQYYAPHGYIMSDKIVHEPDCIAINQNEKKILTGMDYFQDVYINNKYENCPICNPKEPSISEARECLNKVQNDYSYFLGSEEKYQKMINDVEKAIDISHSMYLTKGMYYVFAEENGITYYKGHIYQNPEDEATNREKEQVYVPQLLRSIGYNCNNFSEIYSNYNNALLETKKEAELYNELNFLYDYIYQRKNIFYFFNK